MKLLFRQRAFSWFDSYDIYDENENTVYVVKGQLSWGHCLKIYDPEEQQELGTVKEEILTWLPKFELYEGETCIGTLKKEMGYKRLIAVHQPFTYSRTVMSGILSTSTKSLNSILVRLYVNGWWTAIRRL